MEQSIKFISEGAPFELKFKKIVVEKCYYINAIDERVEPTSILSRADATIIRYFNHGTISIRVFDGIIGRVFPLAKFRLTTANYHRTEHSEVSQTSMMRGNEIIEELPLTLGAFENGIINMFMISKQKNGLIAYLIVNIEGVDDFYYRIMFLEN